MAMICSKAVYQLWKIHASAIGEAMVWLKKQD